MSKELIQIKELCESSFKDYAEWVLPDRYFGDLHYDMFDFLQYEEADSKCVLVPRDHQKSVVIATFASWLITREPSATINYVSYNSDLVEKQIAFIKNILTSDRHRALWSNDGLPGENLLNFIKERGEWKHKPTHYWQNVKFKVDHPAAKNSADPTLRAGTVRGGNTGMHCKYTIFDDLVTDENWKSASDKAETLACYESFSKIQSNGGKTFAVGTRYSPDDLYAQLKEEELRYLEEETDEEVVEKTWKFFERVVEDSPTRDGTGNYCWPKMKMPNGESYGFDRRELAVKKAKLSKNGLTNFFAQYYNDPNDESTNVIKSDCFHYLDPRRLKQEGSSWSYEDKPLRIYAAADLAFSDGAGKDGRRRDYTAIAVVAIDHEGYIYVLDLDRFKTDKPEVYFERIMELHDYWNFKELYVETNNAGKFVKQYLVDEVRRNGGTLKVEGSAHVSHQGKKEERIAQVLHDRYYNGTIYHNKGGFSRLLEEELKLARPPHDDLKDAVAMAVSRCVKPLQSRTRTTSRNVIKASNRFGGARRSRRA